MFLFIFETERERERDCEWGRGRERDRHRIQSRLLGSELSAQSLTWGSNSRTTRS